MNTNEFLIVLLCPQIRWCETVLFVAEKNGTILNTVLLLFILLLERK